VLILDGDGFTDHATLAAAGFVRWEDVHSVSEQPFAGRIFVTVTAADRAAFRRRLPAWRRPFLRINQYLVGVMCSSRTACSRCLQGTS
jgi:hypothetical protein